MISLLTLDCISSLILQLELVTILDIILADDQQIITSVTADAPVGLSDHIMVTFKIVLVVGMTCQNISSVAERPIYISGG